MRNRFAVMDLGSNTFHLLIVEFESPNSFKEVHRIRVYTKLSQGGKQEILSSSYDKGIECLKSFKKAMIDFKVKNYRAIGTATLRTASNGKDFLAYAKEKIGIEIELIDGEKEAELIAKGVLTAVGRLKGPGLIMDIGGGSVEFILIKENKISYLQSFKIGLGILKSKFHQLDPMNENEVSAMIDFLALELKPLIEACSKTNIEYLIGASGTFEVLQEMSDASPRNAHSYSCQISDFTAIHHDIKKLSYKERLDHPNIPDQRADLMVVALHLINFVIHECGPKELIISDFALKEGLLHSFRSIYLD